MQVTQAVSPAMSRHISTAREVEAREPGARAPETRGPSSFLNAMRESIPDEASAVFQKYSLHSISPREVDQLVGELRAAGFDDIKGILMLETRGEAFQSHFQEISAEITGHPPDAAARADFARRMSTPTDLIDAFRNDAEMARRRGDPSEFAEQMADYLDQIDRQAHARTTASPAMPYTAAQTAIEARLMQG
jgi:hypothetical protein